MGQLYLPISDLWSSSSHQNFYQRFNKGFRNLSSNSLKNFALPVLASTFGIAFLYRISHFDNAFPYQKKISQVFGILFEDLNIYWTRSTQQSCKFFCQKDNDKYDIRKSKPEFLISKFYNFVSLYCFCYPEPDTECGYILCKA